MYHGKTRFKGIHTGNDLLVNTKEEGVIVPHLPREVFPEYYLIRVNVYDKIPETPLDEWLTYLKTGKVAENTRTPGLQEVKKKLQYLSMTPKERREYDAHMDTIMVQNDVLATARDEGMAEGLEKGRAEGLEKGLEKGRAEGVASIVRKLISSGMGNAAIREITGLSIHEIEAIRNDVK